MTTDEGDENRNERHKAGMETLRKLHPGLATGFTEALGEFAPELVRLTTEYCFADLYAREELDPRLRQTATLAAMIAQGVPDGILKNHFEIARNVGLKRLIARVSIPPPTPKLA